MLGFPAAPEPALLASAPRELMCRKPVSKELLKFSRPLPEDLENLLDSLENAPP